MASVVALLVTPVKSLRIHRTDAVRVERWGAVGNRVFYLAEQDGRLLNGSKGTPLHRLIADWDAGADRLSIAFPNGLVAEGSGQADGRPITTSFYGRRVSAKEVDGPFAQALSDYVGRPVLLARPDREGDANDDARCRCARRPPPRSWPASRESPRRLTSGGSGCWSWWTAPNRTRRMPGAAGRSGWARHGSRSTGCARAAW